MKNCAQSEMHVLQRPFLILSIVGCWRPKSWSTPWKKIMYNVYKIFIVSLKHSMVFTQLMDLLLNVRTPAEFAASLYLLLSTGVSCVKLCILLANRAGIKSLVEALEGEPFAPTDDREIEIQTKFEQISQSNTTYYFALMETTFAFVTLHTLFTNFTERKLTYRAWLPYEYTSSLLVFGITYSLQLLAVLAGSLLHVACDTLFCGLLVHACCQIELLEYRLKTITNDKKNNLKACVQHHDGIYGFTAMVNKEFRLVMFAQFFISMFVLCFTLYRVLQTHGMSYVRMVRLFLYTSCMVTQIFIYCWYGNEVKLKSMELQETLYGIDWRTFDQDAKKSLLIIMKRSVVPIEFNSAFLVSMNLDSFTNVLKTAYSAYNLLQQM